MEIFLRIGCLTYLTPVDKLNGREALIGHQREDKLQAARQRRQALRQATPANPLAA
jgi:hypothetical protein